MSNDIITKLYWTDGSCGSGDKTLGSMKGKNICGVKKSYESGDLGLTYVTSTPDGGVDSPEVECEAPGVSIFKGPSGTSDPLKFAKSHVCYVNTSTPIKNISTSTGRTCGTGKITLSSVDMGLPPQTASASNFGPLFPAGFASTDEGALNTLFCAPQSDNSDLYTTITVNTPAFRVEDATHSDPKYGFVHDNMNPPRGVPCYDREDMYTAKAGRADAGLGAQTSQAALEGAGKLGTAGAIVGALGSLFDRKRYYKYNCRYPNSVPNKDYATYKYCPLASSHTAYTNGENTITCAYKRPVSNVTLRQMDNMILRGNLDWSAQKVYKELVDEYCQDLENKDIDATVKQGLLNDQSISDYLAPDGRRSQGSRISCAALKGPKDFCRGFANNIAEYSGSACTEENLGTELYNNLWKNFCDLHPGHPNCGCYAISVGKKCPDENIQACTTMNNEYTFIKAADERAYDINTAKKKCFTEVCSRVRNPGMWLPPGYDEGCPDKLEICNKKTSVLKHNRITAFQVLLCKDLKSMADDYPDTPEELARMQENMDAFLADYLAQKKEPEIVEEDNTASYVSSGVSLLLACFCLFFVLIMLKKNPQ